MTFGLMELYEATFEIRYLEEALALNQLMLDLFWDESKGGFFLTASDSEQLLARPKEVYDGAIPSGNSVAALNLLRLGRITGNADLESKADMLFRAFSAEAGRTPSAHAFLMTAVDFAAGPSFEIVIAGSPCGEDARAMAAALHRKFVPSKVVLFRPEIADAPIARIAGFTAGQRSLGGKATAYVCQNYACKAPTTDVNEMIGAIEEPLSPRRSR